MRKLHVSKFNQFRIIVCVIVGLILGLFLVLFSNIFTHFSSNIKTNSVTISCDKEKVKLKIPEETKLSQTQNPILIYSIEKNEDGSEMEIYTQQKASDEIQLSNSSKFGMVFKDETIATFEVYNSEEKDPLRIVPDIQSFKYKRKEIKYSETQLTETSYIYYLVKELSKKDSLLITLESNSKLSEKDFTSILKSVKL